jgi:hypothetical protein
MSLTPISVGELHKISTIGSATKETVLVIKYYNEILVAALQGKYSITFLMESDEYGTVLPEEWSATEKVEKLFPGIQIYYDVVQCSYSFSWYKNM